MDLSYSGLVGDVERLAAMRRAAPTDEDHELVVAAELRARRFLAQTPEHKAAQRSWRSRRLRASAVLHTSRGDEGGCA